MKNDGSIKNVKAEKVSVGEICKMIEGRIKLAEGEESRLKLELTKIKDRAIISPPEAFQSLQMRYKEVEGWAEMQHKTASELMLVQNEIMRMGYVQNAGKA